MGEKYSTMKMKETKSNPEVSEMILKNGVTGFYSDEPVSRENEVDGKEFKAICYSLERNMHAKLIEFNEPGITPNFYHAKFDYQRKEVHVLLNNAYPFVAFASKVEYFAISFIDLPAFADCLTKKNPHYRVLKTEELEESVSIDTRTHAIRNENNLNKQELEQLFYWRNSVNTVGNVIYNYWD